MRRRTFLAAGVAAACVTRPALAETRIFKRGSWKSLLAARAGRPAVVHFWGLTCGPCLAELPAWGRFLATHPNAPLILIAADPIPQPEDQQMHTLARAGLADAEHWSFDGGFSERLYFEVDPDWQGELPRTALLPSSESWLGETDFARLSTWLSAVSG